MALTAAEWITTADAGRLTGRPAQVFRAAIGKAQIPAVKDGDGFWRMPRDEALAWDARTPRRPRPGHQVRGYQQVATLLEEFGTLNVDELSALLGVHAGNVRKHLAILDRQGRARRRVDGQWELQAQPVNAVA
jgi:predicted ArsR family transcriptional regulator